MTPSMDGISSHQLSHISTSRAPIESKIAASVLVKLKGQQEAEGEASVKLIEAARLARAPGLGERLDVRA